MRLQLSYNYCSFQLQYPIHPIEGNTQLRTVYSRSLSPLIAGGKNVVSRVD